MIERGMMCRKLKETAELRISCSSGQIMDKDVNPIRPSHLPWDYDVEIA